MVLLGPSRLLASPCENSQQPGSGVDKIPCTIIDVGFLLANKNHGKALRSIARSFEIANPDIRINLLAFNDSEYKAKLETWVNEHKGPDILYWQGGERLSSLVRKGAIKDISELWQQHEWESAFPAPIADLVRHENRFYGLPFALYQWGFYYKKSYFEKLGLHPPQDWDAFLEIGRKVKASGAEFIAIGTKEEWPIAAWFDYLDLRSNGPEFHQALISGTVSFNDPKIQRVFETLSGLISDRFFVPNYDSYSWSEAMPMVYREMAAVTLMGNFVETSIPETIRDDIGFFPFPAMEFGIGSAELYPTEVWAMASWTRHETEAEKFLEFLSRRENQRQLARGLGYLPARNDPTTRLSNLSDKGKKLLDRTTRVFQYFDRDFNQDFSSRAVNILHHFMLNPNTVAVSNALESHRYLIPQGQ